MSKGEIKDLMQFLKPFSDDIIDIIMWLRDFAWDLCPDANELIYDNYNAVAFGWSPTEKVSHTICSIAVGRTSKNVHFGFYWGSEIPDPDHILSGNGNQYRYLLVTDKKKFPKSYIKTLVKKAYANVLSKVKPSDEMKSGLTIVKSISGKKRPEKLGAKGKARKIIVK